jgi:hypothetical protein
MRDSRSRLVNLIACQSDQDKAKLLNFNPEWLRDCNDRRFGRRRNGHSVWPVAVGTVNAP